MARGSGLILILSYFISGISLNLSAAGPCATKLSSNFTCATITLDQSEFTGPGPYPLTFHVIPTADNPLYLCEFRFFAPYLVVQAVSTNQGDEPDLIPSDFPIFNDWATSYTLKSLPRIPVQNELTFTIWVESHARYQELRSPFQFSVEFSDSQSCPHNGTTWSSLRDVLSVTRMRDDCLDLSIELSTYFWNQDETGTMRFSAINHCGRVMGSDSETGMGMVLYTGAFTPVVSISESNATGWIQDEWGYTNAYFAPLQPGEEAWIEVTVTAKRPNLSDQPGHTFPSIYWFEEHSLYDGMTYRDFHQTSNYVCNKDDDGQRTRRTESRLEIGTELP